MEIQKVYLDMDGVLADFDRGVKELCHLQPTSQNKERDDAQDDRMWAAIRQIGHFYGKLSLMPGAKEMFDRIYEQFGDRVEVLTGVPKANRGIETAGEDKIEWMKKHLSDKVRMNIVLRKEKKNYCTGPESVLIDDREDTILEWRNLGGTGILHIDPAETLRILWELIVK